MSWVFVGSTVSSLIVWWRRVFIWVVDWVNSFFFYGFVLTLLRNFHWLFLPVIYGWIQSIRVVPFRVSWTCKLGRFSLPSRWLKDSLMLSTNQKINKNPETMEIRFIKKWLMVSDWNRTEWVELPQVWGCRTAFTQLFSQVGYSLGSATAISSFPPFLPQLPAELPNPTWRSKSSNQGLIRFGNFLFVAAGPLPAFSLTHCGTDEVQQPGFSNFPARLVFGWGRLK